MQCHRHATGRASLGPPASNVATTHNYDTTFVGHGAKKKNPRQRLRNKAATAQAVTTSKGLGCIPMPYSIGMRQGGAAHGAACRHSG